MEEIDLEKADINDESAINAAISQLTSKNRETLLLDKGRVIGAVLTKEQYDWFLDKLDESSDISEICERASDLDGSISLDELKKELGED
ncbi:hypothetical protein SG34_023070 [Thalassomonas viridans]|uniref:Uncharacterized protein n=1 Tax=Thalassomonas viridans TaxID=137584 RepID=A0AAE9YZS9_9GAMM|nr:hypothetical protein [Thalassomonas viridans]WDE04196.1 hypothetical protein SG34_023070 [Thalassomonas viridans]